MQKLPVGNIPVLAGNSRQIDQRPCTTQQWRAHKVTALGARRPDDGVRHIQFPEDWDA